jgi:23S rRNA (uracil1939-C5)-methyltransferase
MTIATVNPWQQGQRLELEINELSLTGVGVGRWQDRVVFVADAVPGDHLQVRLTQVKPTYAHAQLEQILTPSPQRVRPACIVADKCGGCQWQQVSYPQQLQEKQTQVVEALRRIGKFVAPVVEPILAAPAPLGYRNKVTYPLALSQGKVQAGYYRKGSHQLINLNQCPVQDPHLNPFLAEIKQDIQAHGWRVYDEQYQRGNLRHLSLRIGRRTGEVLLTLVGQDPNLPELEAQAQAWLERYANLVGVCFNQNNHKGNRIFGPQTITIAGRGSITEQFAGLVLEIGADMFFQVYTEQAEALVNSILQGLNLQGHEQIIDAYCGIGTLSLPLAKHCRQIFGVELHPMAVQQAQTNAARNQIDNASFFASTTEAWLPGVAASIEGKVDIVLLDPPRKGCDPSVISSLRELSPTQIVYMSCNPSTLARDLQQLCGEGLYALERVQPADLFPQTAHVEALAWLRRCS